jgi:hypothetical protein
MTIKIKKFLRIVILILVIPICLGILALCFGEPFLDSFYTGLVFDVLVMALLLAVLFINWVFKDQKI